MAIFDSLAWLKERAAHDAEATVVIFYAGHGWRDRVTGDYYLIQHDTDPADVQGTALSAKELIAALRQIEAQRLLVIFDCCHAEGMATSRDVPTFKLPRDIEIESVPRSIVDALKEGAGRAVFTSCRGKQLSYERPDGKNGVYTYHLLEALQGAGNQPGDTTVRLSNVMNYVGQRVPETVRTIANAEQTPFFDQTAEDFPVALLRAGRGLPIGGWAQVEKEASASKPGVNIGGNMIGGTVNVGDRKVEQGGKYNMNAEQMNGTAIGDGAQVFNQPSGPITQHFAPQGNVNTGGGDYAEGNIDKRSGAFVAGGTVYGPVVGSNSGTMTTSYGNSPVAAGTTRSLDQALERVQQAITKVQQAGNNNLVEDLTSVGGHIQAAIRAEQAGNSERRLGKLREAKASLQNIATAAPGLQELVQELDRVR